MISTFLTGFIGALGVILAGITFLTALKLTELALVHYLDMRASRRRQKEKDYLAAKRRELMGSGKPW